MYRYAEGAGSAARFNYIWDIDFLSSTELICTDRNNYCLRHVDLSLSPPETSTFAGSCTVSGNADGHRLNSALFTYTVSTEVKDDNSTVFVLDNQITLHVIDLKTDSMTTLVAFDSYRYDMKLFGNNLLYFAQYLRVTVFNLDSREESVIAGGESSGSAIGPFNHTSFNYVRGLMPRTDAINTLLLVADYFNNRFAVLFLGVR